jgi:hypothetical protein
MPEENWPSWSTGLRKSAVEIERVVDLSAADEIGPDGAAARHAARPETQESKSRMSTATDAELVALGERFEKLPPMRRRVLCVRPFAL